MKLSELHTDQILTDRNGFMWRVTAVNLPKDKAQKAHFLADMLEPSQISGASYIGGNWDESALKNFERCITAT